MFLSCRDLLKDYKSECNPSKMLKTYFFLVALQALNLQLCQKINSTTSIFQLKKFQRIEQYQRIEQQFLNSMYGMLLKVYRSSFPAVATCTFT